MKLKINILNFLLVFVAVLLFFPPSISAAGQSQLPVEPDTWALVGLLISEIAAIVSKKYTGIIQGLFLLTRSIFSKKK